uniref:oligopeptide/dipeptide ABC transporter ATP-binding protein n=1 Tax=Actinotalea sp. TaxID=1872145 RepID=UPI003563AF4B
RSTCDELLVLYAGQVLESGPAAQVLATPGHPYTRALHAANPPLDVRLAHLPAVEGSVPRPATVLDRCPFAARCPHVHEECTAERPVLLPITPERSSACVLGAEYLAIDAAPDQGPAATGDEVGHEALVSISTLTKTFPGARRPALGGVDVEIRAGECVGVVGESGSGKTTLARCLIGLESADSGSIEFHGALRNGRPTDRPRHTAMQIVFQDPYSALNPALRIRTTLAEALAVAGRPASDVAELLTMVGLPAHYADRRPRSLSGGERQRVAIARALATRPTLLVCDESVSALDVTVQAQVLNLLAELRASLGLSMLFISHDLAVVRQVADRIYVMLDGEVVEQGPADGVLSAPEHPYTRRLMAAAPGRAGQEER